VGIFKRILTRKGTPEEKVAPRKSNKKKASPTEKVDPLAALGGEEGISQIPESPPPRKKGEAESTLPWEEPTDEQRAPLPPPLPQNPSLHPTLGRNNTCKEGEDVPDIRGSTGNPLRDRIQEAERGLAEMERALGESTFLFQGVESHLPRLKILLVETKIKLAEADIKTTEAELDPGGSSSLEEEIESRISLAEAKIGDAEKILSSLPPIGQGRDALSRLKIRMAAMKIRLAEIQIALAGSSLETGPILSDRRPVVSPPIRSIQPDPLSSSLPPDTGSSRVLVPTEPAPIRDPSPEQVRIFGAEGEGIDPTGPQREPVRIRQDGDDPASSRTDQKNRVILPEIAGDSSPFVSGIIRDRLRNEETGAALESEAARQERVKIRSDERDSAWVTEDGSLKIVTREKRTGSEAPGDEEMPRISIRQPEVEQVLVIEELNRKGIELRKKGEIEEAITCFDRVLEMDPNNEAALHNRGVALRSAGRFEEALASFDHALERDPDNEMIWFNRGFCLGKLERYEEALKAFDRVLALSPDHASGWYNKGKILEKMGRKEEAEEHLAKARELGFH
jgi:Flp pilus assembly protein TadD